ncbi:MAG: HD domain-containing protein [Lachnospiraceae bacterium]|nr:HD domain-containing protein [Lachnospiraceae bacterium]MCD8249688.1 HD domain-containing protein [Lachnospiraceae bacterium]
MERLLAAMMEYDKGDPKRIQHFIKVYEFARTIGKLERLDEHTQFILESAATVHDIGIHPAEEKYGNCSGKYQELEGPPEAEKLLKSLGWPEDVTERVSYLVGHHHTYSQIEGSDYQILVEADFLVNLFEDESSQQTKRSVYRKIFRTQAGKRLFAAQFPAAVEAES